MKKLLCLLLALAMLTGCAAGPTETTGPVETTAPAADGEVLIRLSDEGVEFPEDSGVHVANDIIYYEAGHGEDYGEGEAWEAHTPEEATGSRASCPWARSPWTWAKTPRTTPPLRWC